MIFHSKGRKIDLGNIKVVLDSNEIGATPDPNLIFELEWIYDNHTNEKLRTFKILGVYFDETLTFNKHAAYVCAKLSRSIFCMKRASNFLSLKSLRSLYFAMVHSHLLYCSIILSCTSTTNLNAIGKLQKRQLESWLNQTTMHILNPYSVLIKYFCLINSYFKINYYFSTQLNTNMRPILLMKYGQKILNVLSITIFVILINTQYR